MLHGFLEFGGYLPETSGPSLASLVSLASGPSLASSASFASGPSAASFASAGSLASFASIYPESAAGDVAAGAVDVSAAFAVVTRANNAPVLTKDPAAIRAIFFFSSNVFPF